MNPVNWIFLSFFFIPNDVTMTLFSPLLGVMHLLVCICTVVRVRSSHCLFVERFITISLLRASFIRDV